MSGVKGEGSCPRNRGTDELEFFLRFFFLGRGSTIIVLNLPPNRVTPTPYGPQLLACRLASPARPLALCTGCTLRPCLITALPPQHRTALCPAVDPPPLTPPPGDPAAGQRWEAYPRGRGDDRCGAGARLLDGESRAGGVARGGRVAHAATTPHLRKPPYLSTRAPLAPLRPSRMRLRSTASF